MSPNWGRTGDCASVRALPAQSAGGRRIAREPDGPRAAARSAALQSLQAEPYLSKLLTPEQAVQQVKPGHRVFVGTACATPRALIRALEQVTPTPPDVELIHFLTTDSIAHDAQGAPVTKYRHQCFFVGMDMREAVKRGQAEYLPVSIAAVPELFNIGRYGLDVAFIQVSPPDRFGYVSLGVSVDVVLAAVQNLSLKSMAAVAYIAWISTLLGFGLWTYLMSRYPVNRVAPFTLLVPVVGLTTGWVAFGEQLLPVHFAGAGLLMAGLVVNVFGGPLWSAVMGRLRAAR